jgi:hypothetical protein
MVRLLITLLFTTTLAHAGSLFVKYRTSSAGPLKLAKLEKMKVLRDYTRLSLLKLSSPQADACEKLLKHPEVEYCEMNTDLKFEEAGCATLLPEGLSIQETAQFVAECQLLDSPMEYPPMREGLSQLWAQEYTGADLVRSELEKLQLSHHGEIEYIDGHQQGHASRVGHLMAGPHPSALVPALKLPHLYEANDIESLVAVFDQIHERPAAPYLNMSLGFNGSQVVSDALQTITERGSVLVMSAGNEGLRKPVDMKKSQLSAILVGSSKPDGTMSDFSQYSTAIDVTAPSNYEILSHDSRAPIYFGGTSGAAPQVTASLASFTMVTGVNLTNAQAERLLKKTALTLGHHLLDPQTHGSGSLNSFKIFQIAQRLRQHCPGPDRTGCVTAKLDADATYEFEPTPIPGLAAAFPQCFSTARSALVPDCESRKRLFNQLRREAFLAQKNSHLWEQLACLHRMQGLSVNADYYQTLSESTDLARYQASFPARLRRGTYNPAMDAQGLVELLRSNPKGLADIQEQKRDDIFFELVNGTQLTVDQIVSLARMSARDTEPSRFDRYLMVLLRMEESYIRHPDLAISLMDQNDFDLTEWVMLMREPVWGENPKAVAHLLQKIHDHPDLTRRAQGIALSKLPHLRNLPEIQRWRRKLQSR